MLDGYNIICHNSLMENILHERNVLEVIDKALELEKITFLLGSRQTGKTSLMKLILDRFSKR